jgi:hypothetical protein
MITILDDLTIDPHPLYHVSPKLFDFPSREEINRAREWSPWHANGVLGLWCSTFPMMCSPFGKQIYQVEMSSKAKVIGLPFGEFQRLTERMEDFDELIDYLTKQGDVAYIVDANPFVGEVIVLNFEMIKSFENVTGSELKDRRFPLRSQRDY